MKGYKAFMGVVSRISFIVDNGRKVKFWRDKWCANEPLYVSFPSLFALASSKEALGGEHVVVLF